MAYSAFAVSMHGALSSILGKPTAAKSRHSDTMKKHNKKLRLYSRANVKRKAKAVKRAIAVMNRNKQEREMRKQY